MSPKQPALPNPTPLVFFFFFLSGMGRLPGSSRRSLIDGVAFHPTDQGQNQETRPLVWNSAPQTTNRLSFKGSFILPFGPSSRDLLTLPPHPVPHSLPATSLLEPRKCQLTDSLRNASQIRTLLCHQSLQRLPGWPRSLFLPCFSSLAFRGSLTISEAFPFATMPVSTYIPCTRGGRGLVSGVLSPPLSVTPTEKSLTPNKPTKASAPSWSGPALFPKATARLRLLSSLPCMGLHRHSNTYASSSQGHLCYFTLSP